MTVAMRLRACVWSAMLVGLCCAAPGCQPSSQVGGSEDSAQAGAADQGMRAVTYSRQPMADRQAAVERMLATDAAGFWADCASLTRQIDDWPMIRLLSAKAKQTNDKRAIPWLIRSWAMPSKTVKDQDRPERDALSSITGADANELLSKTVFDPTQADAPATQVAAWTVLVRTGDHEQLRERITATPDDRASLLVSMLKQAAPAVDVLPADRLAIARLMRLVAAYPDEQWQAWAAWRKSHAGDEPATLALRHLPAIKHRDAAQDDWTRERWIKHIETRLAGRQHAARGSGADDDVVVRKHPGRFEDYVDRLGVADLLVLDALLNAMDDPAVVRIAFVQAEADRLDTSTELGGVLSYDKQGALKLVPIDPLMRQHDQAYIASTRCINAVYVGLAHFHFHTQRYNNGAWAGPGQGDRGFADSHHATAIVMTFLDQRTLNVDAYMPGGISIDLGCMTR